MFSILMRTADLAIQGQRLPTWLEGQTLAVPLVIMSEQYLCRKDEILVLVIQFMGSA